MSGRLVLELTPSRRLAAVLICAHGAAAAGIWVVLPGSAGVLLGAALVALGLAAGWSRGLLGARGSVRALEIEGPALTIRLASGERLATELTGRRFVARAMVALPLRRPARRTLLITAGMLGRREFRLLRIWALWGKLPGVAATQLAA